LHKEDKGGKEMNYRAQFSINFSSTSGDYGDYSNKKVAKISARNMAIGNCQKGQIGYWQVIDENKNTVYSGRVKA
jgi:hypothetical protein